MVNQTKDNSITRGVSGKNSDTGQPSSANIPSRRDRRVARAAVLEPLFFSALFCFAEYLIEITTPVPKGTGIVPFILQIISSSIDTFIGYFAATLISMVVFLLLQQYYYKCFAGLDDDRAIFPLGIVVVIYFAVFLLYLAIKRTFVKWLLSFLTVLVGITVWFSLRNDVQKIEKESESADYTASVFVSDGPASHHPF